MTGKQPEALPVIAYLRADKQGAPLWAEACVCEDDAFPMDEDDTDASGEPVVSMPMVRQADAVAIIAGLTAELEALRKDKARLAEMLANRVRQVELDTAMFARGPLRGTRC